MKFDGTVFYRSSKSGADPRKAPGEEQLRALNPNRYLKILEATGWSLVASGTLNLRVEPKIVDALGTQLHPVIREAGEDVQYPAGWEHIPKMRKGWLYYMGRVHVGGNVQPVLVRRGMVPLRDVVELFASENLTNRFSLTEGHRLSVEMDDGPA